MTAEANCHGDTAPTTPSRRRAAATTAPTASTASANVVLVGRSRSCSGSSWNQQRGEQRPCRRRVPGERAQPAPHRGHWPPEPISDPSVAGTGGLRPQRGTDRLDRVSPPPQASDAQQHMRHPTADAADPARPQNTSPTNGPWPSESPWCKKAATPTDQFTGRQPPLDLGCIGTYHDHGCLHAPRNGPPFRPRNWGGPLRLHQRDQIVVAHQPAADRRPTQWTSSPAASPPR